VREMIEALKELIEVRRGCPEDIKPAINKAIDALTRAIVRQSESPAPPPGYYYPQSPKAPYIEWVTGPTNLCKAEAEEEK